VINASSMTSLNTETLKKTRITHELGLQDLDCNIAKNYFIVRTPYLAHTADGNAIN
jgi:hypothetical protein